jgi:hypothetical protein
MKFTGVILRRLPTILRLFTCDKWQQKEEKEMGGPEHDNRQRFGNTMANFATIYKLLTASYSALEQVNSARKNAILR